MSAEPRSALERIRAADRALGDIDLGPRADARIRGRLATTGDRRRGRGGRFALLGAAAAAIGLAVALTRPVPADIPRCHPGPAPSRCVVAWAESRIVVEPGGHIETGSHSVRLLAGRARFAVEPRGPGAGPYRVRAAGATIDVIGTAFSVTARADGGSVTLHHGRIALSTPMARRTIADRPGATLRWSDVPEPPQPAERPPPTAAPSRGESARPAGVPPPTQPSR